jgi:hypothetical protein
MAYLRNVSIDESVMYSSIVEQFMNDETGKEAVVANSKIFCLIHLGGLKKLTETSVKFFLDPVDIRTVDVLKSC